MRAGQKPVPVRSARKRLVLGRLAVGSLLAATSVVPLGAQQRGQYYDGMRHGYDGRHGNGYNDQYDHRYYDNRDEYNRTHGGIGPGRGALIGGAGGAALGALFGGGLKGALIGGGAGAGIGAIAGKVHQDNKQNDWRDYRDGRPR